MDVSKTRGEGGIGLLMGKVGGWMGQGGTFKVVSRAGRVASVGGQVITLLVSFTPLNA